MSYGEDPERGEPPLTLGRRGGGSPPPPAQRPAPVTLIVSLVILVGVIGAVAWLYRGGVRGPDGGPPLVGQSAESARTTAPAQSQAPDAAAGLSIYKDAEPTSAAPTFAPGPETPGPRTGPSPAPAPPPPSAGAKPAGGDAIGDLVDKSEAPKAESPKVHKAPAASRAEAATSPTGAAPRRPSASPSAPMAKAAASAAVPAGGIAVQIGAFSTRALAEAAWTAAAQAAPGAMAGHGRSISSVSVGGKTLYRAAITGFSGRAGAVKLCEDLKAAGRSCFVR